MLHIIAGTKGQLIKMAPIMMEMDRQKVEYKFINAAQHGKILDDISSLFQLRKYDYVFYGFERDLTKSSEILWWLAVNVAKNSFGGRIFRRGDCVALHGDAPPALLGLLIAKTRGMKVIHVEAGERTHKLSEPFPEEFIRRIVDRYSSYLFTMSEEAYLNLKNSDSRGKKWRIKTNTILDSVRIAIKHGGAVSPPREDYVLASIHRFETSSNYGRLERVVKTVGKASEEYKVVFPLHESTKRQLEAKHLIDELKSNRQIVIMSLLDYFSFIRHINGAQYVITDGAGPQQETGMLGKPCLVMRDVTERIEYPNVYIAGFDLKKIDYFIKNYKEYRSLNILKKFKGYSPSRQIVKLIRENSIT